MSSQTTRPVAPFSDSRTSDSRTSDSRTSDSRTSAPPASGSLDVAVVGAGISGLTAAFWLKLAGRRVAVLEASDRIGGAMTTHRDGPWLFELGPNTVVEKNSAVSDLIREAELGKSKIEADPTAKKRFLFRGETIHALPGGPPGFLRTRLFSTGAKLRLLREPWIRAAAPEVEETIAQFVRRRLGEEFLRNAVGPFVSGIYAGDPERLSVVWATPRIYDIERRYGSLIRGALAKRKGPAPAGSMISFTEGLDTLPRRLAERIGDVRTATRVERITSSGDGYRLETAGGKIEAKEVVLAAPAEATAAMLAALSGGASHLFAEIPYAPVAVVALGMRREDVAHPLDGFGFLVPRGEGPRLLGCLFPSSLFAGRAPEGHVALSAFLGGRTDPDIVSWDDERLLGQVLTELRGAIGLRGDPRTVVIRRWPRAIPQYEIGHGRFVELAGRLERDHPGLHLGGSFLGGISVPDCIENAAKVACDILAC